MRRWVVFSHPFWQCVADGVPYLMSQGDKLDIVEPGHFEVEAGVENVVMHPHLSLETAHQFHHPDVTLFETEQLFGSEPWRKRSEKIREACPKQRWLNFSAVASRVYGDTHHPMMVREDLQVGRCQGPYLYDVLFVGSINSRRAEILQALAQLGVKVKIVGTKNPAYGLELGQIVDQSRLLLNIHYYDPAMFECFRCVPAWHREAPIVSERSLGDEGAEWAECVPYDQLVKKVLKCLQFLK